MLQKSDQLKKDLFKTKNYAYIEGIEQKSMLLLAIADAQWDLGTVTIAGSQHQQPKWDLKLASWSNLWMYKKISCKSFFTFWNKKIFPFKVVKTHI